MLQSGSDVAGILTDEESLRIAIEESKENIANMAKNPLAEILVVERLIVEMELQKLEAVQYWDRRIAVQRERIAELRKKKQDGDSVYYDEEEDEDAAEEAAASSDGDSVYYDEEEDEDAAEEAAASSDGDSVYSDEEEDEDADEEAAAVSDGDSVYCDEEEDKDADEEAAASSDGDSVYSDKEEDEDADEEAAAPSGLGFLFGPETRASRSNQRQHVAPVAAARPEPTAPEPTRPAPIASRNSSNETKYENSHAERPISKFEALRKKFEQKDGNVPTSAPKSPIGRRPRGVSISIQSRSGNFLNTGAQESRPSSNSFDPKRQKAVADKMQQRKNLVLARHISEEGECVCPICLCEIEIHERQFLVEKCGHNHHEGCMKRHVNMCMDNGKLPVLCPSCQAGIDKKKISIMGAMRGVPVSKKPTKLQEQQLNDILNESESNRLAQKYQELYTLENPTMTVCSTTDCGFAVQTRGQWLKYGENSFWCPKCDRHKCKNCKTDWHIDQTCDEYREAKREAEAKREEDERVRLGFKKCPHCSVVVERTGGCNHITCPCRNHWCYRCEVLLDDHGPLYDGHYNGVTCSLFEGLGGVYDLTM